MTVIPTDRVVVCIKNKARLSVAQIFVTVTKSFLCVRFECEYAHDLDCYRSIVRWLE